MPINLAKRPTPTALGRAIRKPAAILLHWPGETALWHFRPPSRSGGHPHSFLGNMFLLVSEAYAPIEQLILNQLLNVLVKALKMKRLTTAIPKAR